ncbi:MAG: aspartoacylase [Arthrospira sp. PLM2.Bin9]|nr:aspartoacylase [Arthrospira sp. PLM2.Bin9]TVU52147.1 MAG: aspartoacylase [Arthrospira sp. PLM2.Bin9]
MGLTAENHDQIKRVAIVGGTHGNEWTGIYLIKKFERSPELLRRSNFETFTLLANPRAWEINRRYVDRDLNRSFRRQDLENTNSDIYEIQRSQWIASQWGPQSPSPIDTIIDLHSSTAHMGLTLIWVKNNAFNRQISAYLKGIFPEINIYSWIESESQPENPSLKSLCNYGFSIEVGPIAPGMLDAALFLKAEKVIYALLDYIEKYNRGEIMESDRTLTIYQYIKQIDYPRTATGELAAMIHPQLQGRDYQQLNPGDPMFLQFDGTTIYYQGETPVWPIFINEAAYYEKAIAMIFTEPQTIEIYE